MDKTLTTYHNLGKHADKWLVSHVLIRLRIADTLSMPQKQPPKQVWQGAAGLCDLIIDEVC
jgi:hypothetical protein